MAQLTNELPPLALSVRQPWAWAIIHGGKIIENRSLGAIKAGNMDLRRICIHAASTMRRNEYEWGVWRLARHGVRCPRPDTLIYGGIIGTVEVVDIVTESDSQWFGGEAGLVLSKPEPVDPIPAKGALGYFSWHPSEAFAPLTSWMQSWDQPNGDDATLSLFDDELSFREPPAKPFKKSKPDG